MAHSSIPQDTSISSPINPLKKLWPYLWHQQSLFIKIRFIVAVLCLILAKVSTLMIPQFYKQSVDSLMPTVDGVILVPFFAIVSYGVARLLATAFSECRDVVFATVAQEAVRRVGLAVFEHLHNLSLRYHLDRQTGGLTRSIERGTKGVESLLQFLTFNIIPTLVEILLVSGLLWRLYGESYAAITFLTLVVYVAYTLLITNWRIQFVRTMNQMDNEASSKAIDSLLNYETVKYFNNEHHEANRYDTALRAYRKSAVSSKMTLSILNTGQSIIITLGLMGIMFLAGYDIQLKILTVGDFVALNAYLIQLYTPLNLLGFAYREVKISLVNLENMFGLMQEPCEIIDQNQAKDIVCEKGEIVFDHVSFSYGKERSILKDISFTVPAGKTLAIVGASGAGKSTMSRLLFRFYDVTSGAIRIDGQDLREVTQESLRRVIGIVPQDTVLFNESIGYNIGYGRPSATQAEIIEAAQAAHIHEFIESLPEGYETRVGERGLKLSGGEKQRVAIARALLKKPKIFLFDEATSALDTRTEQQIQENLWQVSRDFTTVVIAHRLSTIVSADQIIVLEKGHVVESGTHEVLLSKKGTYSLMWQRQQGE